MASRANETRKTYGFTLVLAGQTALTDEIADALHAAGCDDATLWGRGGVLFLDFDREAHSLREAITSAVTDVARAGVGLRVVRVEPDELVTASEIARRIGKTKEAVRLYAVGRRGPGNFPPPFAGASQKTPLYRWSDIADWVQNHRAVVESGPKARTKTKDLADVGSEALAPADARIIGAFNAVLDLSRFVSDPDEANAIMRVAQLWGGRVPESMMAPRGKARFRAPSKVKSNK
ncbi:MAG: hypothetical protein WKF75_18685 [Singulisphaera sp.]